MPGSWGNCWIDTLPQWQWQAAAGKAPGGTELFLHSKVSPSRPGEQAPADSSDQTSPTANTSIAPTAAGCPFTFSSTLSKRSADSRPLGPLAQLLLPSGQWVVSNWQGHHQGPASQGPLQAWVPCLLTPNKLNDQELGKGVVGGCAAHKQVKLQVWCHQVYPRPCPSERSAHVGLTVWVPVASLDSTEPGWAFCHSPQL